MRELLHLLIDTAMVAGLSPKKWRMHPTVLRQVRQEVSAIHWSFVYNSDRSPSLLGLPIEVDVKVIGLTLETGR